MNRSVFSVLVMLLLLLISGDRVHAQDDGLVEPSSPAVALDTAFTYQGRLLDDNTPATGSYDFHFSCSMQPPAAALPATRPP